MGKYLLMRYCMYKAWLVITDITVVQAASTLPTELLEFTRHWNHGVMGDVMYAFQSGVFLPQ